MTSNIADSTQTASLQTTPRSTHGTPIIWPSTMLPGQHMDLTGHLGQPIIAMSANNYPSKMVSNNNIMSTCASAKRVLLEKATGVPHPCMNVLADNSGHSIQNNMADTSQNITFPVSQWNQMQEQLIIIQAQVASLTRQAPSVDTTYLQFQYQYLISNCFTDTIFVHIN